MDNEKELQEQGREEIPSVTPENGEELKSEATESEKVEASKSETDEVEIASNNPTVSESEDSTEEKTEEPQADATESQEGSKSKKEVKLNTEEDLSEKSDDEDEEEEEHEDVDYSNLNKEELVAAIRELSQSSNFIKAERKAREIKPYFDEIKDKERQAALDKFIADGGEEADFDFKNDELTDRFEANYKLIRDHKIQYVKDQENRKDANLKKKQEILEKLREFVDSEETNIEFNAFKAIQNEWKEVGPVPGAYAKTLWANYNALVDRFYDNRHIYFELKELDRKKNLESKLELCEKAEALSKVENVSQAIKDLNDLHHEFKHIGPVPNDEREPLWQRFKAASDAVYDRRKDFIEGLKEELEANLVVKEELAKQVQEFTQFDSDRIKEWNKKTKELQEIQKKWEATGGLPRAKAKEINKTFWSAFKTFFNNKGQFFKKLDSMREGNLEKKKELLEKANELKTSTEWQKTANELKKLQNQWREIGPVPEKFRESVYREFKEACDYFFDQKRAQLGEAEKDFSENLKKKEAICEEIVKLAENKTSDLDKFRELQDQFNEIGFVPKNAISKIKSKWSEAVDKFINSIEGITNEERQKIRIENQINKLKSGPNASDKIYRKEQTIRKQIGQLENDIAVWKNNMEFFANSKTADKLKGEFETKIDAASKELKGLKSQLRIVREYS
ncbi:DUF349 domain-containing protein [Fulvivirga lutea]|uniref:DUF349 domain-containing protein n=2 Tax=Fulvivirga lutea TaxID=2810512 RepID=A0A975A2L0_9BACT|nr:DUF349 domain-containing protein [Fulvivirga lutea]